MAFCSKCGSQLGEGVAFCSVCGTKVESPPDEGSNTVNPPPGFSGTGQLNIMETLFRPFKDARWLQKFLLGGLIALIPIVGGLFVQGYTWLYCRRVIGRRFDLPEWDGWGEMLSRGFGVFLIGLVYVALPIIAALLLGVAGGGVMSAIHNPSAVCGVCLVPALVLLVVTFFCFFFYPLSLTSYAAEANLGAAFDFARFWEIANENFTEYLFSYLSIFVAAVVVMAGIFVIAMLLVWIPCLGWIALMLVSGAGGLTIGLMATSTFGEFYALRVR